MFGLASIIAEANSRSRFLVSDGRPRFTLYPPRNAFRNDSVARESDNAFTFLNTKRGKRMAVLDVTTRLRRAWRSVAGPGERELPITIAPIARGRRAASDVEIALAPNDPLVAYFQSAA